MRGFFPFRLRSGSESQAKKSNRRNKGKADSLREQQEEQRQEQLQQQIPSGDDNQKNNGEDKSYLVE